MPFYTDQIGNKIELSALPRRIVSLVPSQTELLCDLGLNDEVVGITRFCIHPNEWCQTKTKIGGTKQFNFNAIHALKPDLIIGNKEENYKEGIEELQKQYPVWLSDIFNLKDALEMMLQIGAITDRSAKAENLVATIAAKFQQLQHTQDCFVPRNDDVFLPEQPPNCERRMSEAISKTTFQLPKQIIKSRVAYFIWRKPYMVAASSTFIDAMLQTIGFVNCFEDDARYPEITLAQLQQQQPDFIFLSSEPYSFKEHHFSEFQQACPHAKIVLVDGEMFSWYGSRLLHSPDYFISLMGKK